MNYQVLDINGKLYKLVRIIRDNRNWDFEILRQFWHCTHTFRKEGAIYFVREIEDVLEYEEFS